MGHVSVVIRNKNESDALGKMLPMLFHYYKDDIAEVIVVDNQSTDNSVEIAKQYGCKVIAIDKFTYGKALNLGIGHAIHNYVLLLSAHALPIGASFFKSAIAAFENDRDLAGVRFVNSFANYQDAYNSPDSINNPLEKGLMNACAMINKKVWEQYPFDESLGFSEDKYWSALVMKHGYTIKNITETFFYFAKRDQTASINRFKNESIANGIINNNKPTSLLKVFLSSFYAMTIDNVMTFLKRIGYEAKLLKAKLAIRKALKRHKP
ncbi:MAG: glycosyltransferase [Mesoflavibacter sp.]|nr:glycosyltransferase [Mesoflavibacter sp.]